MDGKKKTNESQDPARDIEVRDVFHFFRALEEPDGEKRVAEYRAETQRVDHPVVPELRDKKNGAGEDREARERQRDLHHHDRRENIADFRGPVLAERNLLGGRDAESVIGKDHEVLHEGLREGDQPEFFGADDPEKIREDQNGQDVGDRLEDRKRGEIAEHHPAFARGREPVSFFDLPDQRAHGAQSTVFQRQRQQTRDQRPALGRIRDIR